MADLKSKHREAGDKTAENMAEKFHREHLQDLVLRCATEWHKEAARAKAERRRLEQERAMAQLRREQEEERRKNREKGDATADRMAQKFRREHIHQVAQT